MNEIRLSCHACFTHGPCIAGAVYTKKSKIAESFLKQNISRTWGYDKAHKANMITKQKRKSHSSVKHTVLDGAAVSIFVLLLVKLTNNVFANSTNITTNIETAALSNTVCLTEL